MAKYLAMFTYTADAWGKMIEQPSDRTGAVSALADALGGSVHAFHWMFSTIDGFAIFEFPDSLSASAVRVAGISTGAFKHIETHELIDPATAHEVLEKARTAREGYRAPGE